MTTPQTTEPPDRDALPRTVGVRVIVGYKIVKAAVAFLTGALILILTAFGLATELHTVASNMRDHATEAWSVALAKWLLDAATARNLHVVALACLLDASFSAFEAWALHRRFWWSGWLIVAATSALLPFEGIALVRHFAAGRVALAAGNVLIVLYLVRLELSGATRVSAGSRSPPAAP